MVPYFIDLITPNTNYSNYPQTEIGNAIMFSKMSHTPTVCFGAFRSCHSLLLPSHETINRQALHPLPETICRHKHRAEMR